MRLHPFKSSCFSWCFNVSANCENVIISKPPKKRRYVNCGIVAILLSGFRFRRGISHAQQLANIHETELDTEKRNERALLLVQFYIAFGLVIA